VGDNERGSSGKHAASGARRLRVFEESAGKMTSIKEVRDSLPNEEELGDARYLPVSKDRITANKKEVR
jgi:hypothetical protein